MKTMLAYLAALTLLFLPLTLIAGAISQRLVLPSLVIFAGWLIWGAKVIALRDLDVPVPAADRIDIKGALRVLWWTLWWPKYL